MFKLNNKQQNIVKILLQKGKAGSSAVYEEYLKNVEQVSFITIKRNLSMLSKMKILEMNGVGRSTLYTVSCLGKLFFEINASDYCSIDPDKRYGRSDYNFKLFSCIPKNVLTAEELEKLDTATRKYKLKAKNLTPLMQKKEIERLVIELSWKSSKIEGNTYTLLDTEKLILENKKAVGKTKEETQMILNHRDAFQYIYENKKQFKTITKKNLEELHSVLIKKLKVKSGFRKGPVGVLGSKYLPLDNIYQITEAVEELFSVVVRMKTSYEKAMLALLGISYIQPFEDGNKRTSRLLANALLLAYDLAPLSYRSIEEEDYREAMLVFYELNSIIPFKKIFLNQYLFATENYIFPLTLNM